MKPAVAAYGLVALTFVVAWCRSAACSDQHLTPPRRLRSVT